MAKQVKSTRPLTFSSDLVKGAALAYGTQNLTGGEIKVPGSNMSAPAANNEMTAANNRVARYLDQMPGTEIDPTIWEGDDARYIAEMAQQDRFLYSDAMGGISRFKPTDPGYSDSIAAKDDILKKYQTLANQQTILKEAIKDLPDFKQGIISNANNPENLSLTTKALTGELPKVVMPNGEIGFKKENGEIVALKDLPDIFAKNVTGLDKIMTIHENYYNAGKPLNEVTRNIAEQRIASVVYSSGINGLKSLAQDYGFTIPQNVLENSDSDPDAAYNAAITSIMELIENGANTGARIADQEKASKTNSRSGNNTPPKNLYLNTDVKRLINSIANSNGQASGVETGDNFLLPHATDGQRLIVSWDKNNIVFKSRGGKFQDPFSGEQVSSSTIPLSEYFEYYGIEFNEENIPFIGFNKGHKGDKPFSLDPNPQPQYPLDK